MRGIVERWKRKKGKAAKAVPFILPFSGLCVERMKRRKQNIIIPKNIVNNRKMKKTRKRKRMVFAIQILSPRPLQSDSVYTESLFAYGKLCEIACVSRGR